MIKSVGSVEGQMVWKGITLSSARTDRTQRSTQTAVAFGYAVSTIKAIQAYTGTGKWLMP